MFQRQSGYVDMPVSVPCGQCIGCRLDKARDWAIRCMHEAKLHDDNCFITLTFDDVHLPENGSISKDDVQRFLKRLRFSIQPKRVSYYAVGEYGEQTGRPHYHILLFGHDFPDKIPLQREGAHTTYSSAVLRALWPYGNNMIGTITWQSAMYCCKYVTKKLYGDVTRIAFDIDTGEWRPVEHEFALMSRNPALGKRYYKKHSGDITAHDSIIIQGKALKPPKYYDKLRAEDELIKAKGERVKAAKQHAANQTLDRLRVREKVAKAKLRRT